MPDISMCRGHNCGRAVNCYRALAVPSERQAYLIPTHPGEACVYFMPLRPGDRLSKGGR